MSQYFKDITSQAESIQGTLDYCRKPDTLKKFRAIAERQYSKIVFSGMGSSHFCSYAANTLLCQNGHIGIVKSASQLYYYDMGLVDSNTLLILISQSGESSEILKILPCIPKGCSVVAITNNMDSALAKRGDFTFLLNVEDEISVTTRTYLASVIIVNLLAKALLGQLDDECLLEMQNAITELQGILKKSKEIGREIATFLHDISFICMIGRGFSLNTVYAASLFINEVAKFPSISYDAGEFRHGPIEMINESFAAFVYAPEGIGFELGIGLAGGIIEKAGRCILITNGDVPIKNDKLMIIGHGKISEFLSNLISIVPAQLYADALAQKRGYVPGKFIWASKVTRAEI